MISDTRIPTVKDRILLKEAGKKKILSFTGSDMRSRIGDQGYKIYKMLESGHTPHYAQLLFHTSKAKRRVLSAGRRSGKTHPAARECAYFSHPLTAVDGLESYGVKIVKGDDGSPKKTLMAAIVIPQEKNHKAAQKNFMESLEEMGLKYGVDFTHNKTAGEINILDMNNKSRVFLQVQIKAVKDDPDKMRSEGYVWVWFDEPAFLTSSEAWDTTLPALMDSDGVAIFTTSPGVSDNNYWLYERFMDDDLELEAVKNVDVIEWTTLDNPFLAKDAIEEAFYSAPWYVFERENLAKWNKPTGDILKPEWIHYYEHSYDQDNSVGFKSDLKLEEGTNKLDRLQYDFYIGVDPAITPKEQIGSSKSRDPDFTAIVVIAKDKETGLGYVVDIRRERIDFPTQLKRIEEMYRVYNPISIGVEAYAYQKALSQMLMTIPGINKQKIVPITAPGSKEERFVSLGGTIESGAIRFNEKLPQKDSDGMHVHEAFLQEYCKFPNAPHDDILDALDICIRSGNLFQNFNPYISEELERDRKIRTSNKLAFHPRYMNKLMKEHNEFLEEKYGDEDGDEDFTVSYADF